jgi:Fe-S oxidoreductase
LPGKVVAEESIWSCTACSACVDVCPLGISPLGLITDMRRSLVADSRLRGAPAVALGRTNRSKNPWGMSSHDRLAWAMGLDVPTVATNPEFDVLYWVGCAAAYDPRLQRVALSVVRLFVHAKVNFAVLGPDEKCNGETARRMGDELLFHQLASENIATFERWGLNRGAKTIVAHCPHCVNSFRLDYPQLGANLRAIHHTEFLAELVETGRLIVPPGSVVPGSVTYHDPCYLARVWNVTDAPRELLRTSATKENLVEMQRRERNTSCCGAGGGRMWFDDAPETRVGRSRVKEALSTGATTLAVACPFCLIMAADGVAEQGGAMEVRDVAEILAAAIFREDAQR